MRPVGRGTSDPPTSTPTRRSGPAGRLPSARAIGIAPRMLTSDEVKRLRQTLGITQRQLAAVLDVTVTTVARWEQGSRRVGSLATYALTHLAQQHGVAQKLQRAAANVLYWRMLDGGEPPVPKPLDETFKPRPGRLRRGR